jgi:hypothetical protein
LVAAAHSSPDLTSQFDGADLSSLSEAEAFIERSFRFDEHAKNWAIVEDGVAVGSLVLPISG